MMCQTEGGFPIEKMSLKLFLPQALEFQTFSKQKTHCPGFKTKKVCIKCVLSIGDLSPSVYLGRHNIIHVINGPGLPPPFLHTASDQKSDGGRIWEQGYSACTLSSFKTVIQRDFKKGRALTRNCGFTVGEVKVSMDMTK